jgi:integrase
MLVSEMEAMSPLKEDDMKYMRLKKGRWYLVKRIKGKFKGHSLNANKDELSKAMRNYGALMARLERGDDPSAGKKKVSSIPYKPKSERERGLFEGSKKKGPHALMLWFGEKKIQEVDDQAIVDYVTSRKGIKGSTIDKELRLLKNVIQEVNKKFELPQVKKNKGKRVSRSLTTDQVRKVLSHVRHQSVEFGDQYVQVFKIMAWSGMDSKDTVYLRWEYVEEKWIKKSRFKSGEPMDAPICKPLAELFKGMVRNIDGRVFHGITSDGNCTAIRRAFQDAGVNGSGKSLRHYYASMMASGGASESQVGHALGHSKGSKCTALYIHSFEEDLEKAVTVFDRVAL